MVCVGGLWVGHCDEWFDCVWLCLQSIKNYGIDVICGRRRREKMYWNSVQWGSFCGAFNKTKCNLKNKNYKSNKNQMLPLNYKTNLSQGYEITIWLCEIESVGQHKMDKSLNSEYRLWICYIYLKNFGIREIYKKVYWIKKIFYKKE